MNTEHEKTGVFIGAYAINPMTNERIPIWIADYVLPGYGTGAIMAVPAHDERDYEFAQKFDLPIRSVVVPDSGQLPEDEALVGHTADEVLDRLGRVHRHAASSDRRDQRPWTSAGMGRPP